MNGSGIDGDELGQPRGRRSRSPDWERPGLHSLAEEGEEVHAEVLVQTDFAGQSETARDGEARRRPETSFAGEKQRGIG